MSKKNLAFELTVTVLLAVALFPISAFFAGFLGFDSLESAIYSHSPEFIFSDEKIEEILASNAGKDELRRIGKVFKAGPFQVLSTREFDIPEFDKRARDASDMLSGFLKSVPWIIPVVKICPAVGQEGAYNGLSILVDPGIENLPSKDGDVLAGLFSVLFHEMTHVYLFWSLFPGTPLDCPRWFNEGMAEEISAKLSGETDETSQILVVNKPDVVPFNSISPGFSRPGLHVELQARHAFACFHKRFGPDGIQKIIRGLSRGRPFRSVFQLEFRENPEEFEGKCYEEFFRTKVLENISELDFQNRLLKTPFIPPKMEYLRSLQSANRYWEENNIIASELCRFTLAKVEQLGRDNNQSLAVSWLKSVKKSLGDDKYEAELKKIHSNRMNEKSSISGASDFQRKSQIPAWFIFLPAAWGFVKLYRVIRKKIAATLYGLWTQNRDGAVSPAKWFFFLFILYWGAWFKRFLIIGMIPYSGIAAIPDYGRILMAEALVMIFYIGLAWQLQKWDRPIPFHRDVEVGHFRPDGEAFQDPRTRTSTGRGFQLPVAGIVLFLFGMTSFPPVMEIISGNFVNSPISRPEFFVTFLSNSLTVIASSYLIWKTSIRWAEIFPKLNLWYLAFIFAILRGGISFDPAGSLFLLFLGRILGELAIHEKKLFLCIGADFICMLPHFFLIPEYFIALDPVGGLFWELQNHNPLWVVPTIGSLVAIIFCKRSAISCQLSAER